MDDYKKQNEIKEYYNQSLYYDNNLKTFSNLNSKFQQYRINKVLEIYKPKKTEILADLGCGWGTFCFALAPECKKIIGVDFSKKSIAICRGLHSKKFNHLKNIEFIRAGADDTNIKSGSTDVIICADLVEHLYPEIYLSMLKECRRILKPGGRLIIWTPCESHFLEIMRKHNFIFKKDISHVDFKTKKYLEKTLEKNGFKIENSYYAESNWPILRIFEKNLMNFIPILRRRIAVLARKT